MRVVHAEHRGRAITRDGRREGTKRPAKDRQMVGTGQLVGQQVLDRPERDGRRCG